MLKLDQARVRHARYFLEVARRAVLENDLSKLEPDLENIRTAWHWVSKDRRDTELIIGYGEVAWQLFAILRIQFLETLTELQTKRFSELNEDMLNQALNKLLEIARIQAQVHATLSPSISAIGERSVAGAIIVNSNVITGNHVVIHSEKET